jgi:hypothetical protein
VLGNRGGPNGVSGHSKGRRREDQMKSRDTPRAVGGENQMKCRDTPRAVGGEVDRCILLQYVRLVDKQGGVILSDMRCFQRDF